MCPSMGINSRNRELMERLQKVDERLSGIINELQASEPRPSDSSHEIELSEREEPELSSSNQELIKKVSTIKKGVAIISEEMRTLSDSEQRIYVQVRNEIASIVIMCSDDSIIKDNADSQ